MSRGSSWLFIALLLGVLWAAGIDRGVWTPDEPREYALSVNMLQHGQSAVPTLSGRSFAEKPPLTYWAAAAAMQVFGATPVAARIPNLLYGLITVICSALLAASMLAPAQRRAGAQLAAIIGGTAWLSYLHTIWLATDAPLLAASAIAWLGAWRALAADNGAARTRGYVLFHLGLALAFLAKNLLGLMAPLMAYALFILWQWRWREFLRWQLWAGLLISGGLIGGWLMAVSGHADGAVLLRTFLWDNSVGRFLPVATTGEYRTGHVNSPGKLISEVALGLLPWLAAAIAAWVFVVRAAFRATAAPALPMTVPLMPAARFLIVSAWPLILLLSFSSTVRDVYALPCMVPLTVAIAWWWTQRNGSEALASSLTRALLWLLGLLAASLGLLVHWLASGDLLPGLPVAGALAMAVVVVGASGVQLARRWSLCRGLGAFGAGLAAFLLLATPVIDAGQDLRPTARAAATFAAGRPLLLAQADETMAAALDYGSNVHGEMTVDFASATRRQATALALVQADADRLTPAMRARLGALHAPWAELGGIQREDSSRLLQQAGWRLVQDLPSPGGRHYQLLSAPAEPKD